MSKKAQDYYKDLEKVDSSKSGFKPVTSFNTPAKKSVVPWGLISLVGGAAALVLFVKYFSNHDLSSVISIVKGKVSMHSKERNLTSVGSGPSTTNPTESDLNVKIDEPKPDDLVEIDGRYYKKTPDNIYIIKGKRVYFVDNRAQKAAAKAH